ncbi:CapA family protein [Salinimicrobium soli]|uniref:CapA family protein n=1 Tax=Salinimicrobium soli TaxID=1254399 RepID=UPI003AAF2BFD
MEAELEEEQKIKLFLCGDVMLGRGIDQAMQHSVDPVIYESYVKDARDYIKLAEKVNGTIGIPVAHKYIWGEALKKWKEEAPDFRLINLETSITTNEEPWPRKGIHYRMHPKNIEALKVAEIDHCSLANNHVLDWGREGLLETLKTLKEADFSFSGAGENYQAALKPSVLKMGKKELLVFSFGSRSSGIPPDWAAKKEISGVNYIENLSAEEQKKVVEEVKKFSSAEDLVVFSIHWGRNWGYEIPSAQKEFAHRLIDGAGVDIVFGHSSHHPLGIEVYKNKLIIYGAGDFFNDYEGISGMEQFRGELTLMYFPEMEVSTGNLIALKMIPLEIKNFQLKKASKKDIEWIYKTLQRESTKLGATLELKNKELWLQW